MDPLPDRPAGGGATPGALHIVSTPIGNLADISQRAIDVLRGASLIVAEDSRVARVLLGSLAIDTPLASLPAFDEAGRIGPIVDRLLAGEAVALISDAGTPLLSDPGSHLVASAVERGIRVVPIPGASALLAAIVASGVAGPRWSFEGFLPRAGVERAAALAAIAADARATVVYEAGNRVAATLADLADACGGERPAALCRELTKLHEEIRRGSLAELAAAAASGSIDSRGEFALVVGAAVPSAPPDPLDPDGPYPPALLAVERAVAGGEARSRAIRRIADAWGLDRRRLWDAAHAGVRRDEAGR